MFALPNLGSCRQEIITCKESTVLMNYVNRMYDFFRSRMYDLIKDFHLMFARKATGGIGGFKRLVEVAG